jgi:tripartite-type tricarboxylate transporter receptor subunit TctC
VLKQLTTQGLDARGGSPEEFALFIKNETERWARVIHQMDAAKDK